MYLDIKNEYSKIRCVSVGHVVNGLNDLGQKIIRHEHEPYEIDICYSNNDNSVTLQDRGMIDTGCTTTHTLWKKYIGFPSYKYFKYPFDSNNKEIKSKDLERPDLLSLNEMIIHKKDAETNASGENTNKRTELFFDQNSYFKINNKVSAKSNSNLCPILEINATVKNTGSISSLLNEFKTVKIRPPQEKNLIGLDTLNQLEFDKRNVFPGMSVLTLREPEINSKIHPSKFIPNSDGFQEVYEIKLFDQGLDLFLKTYQQLDQDFNYKPIEDLNHSDSIFNLNKNILFCDSIYRDMLLHYTTNKTLNLLELQLKDKIKNNGRIDGFMFKSKEKFSDKIISYIKIYLKDVKNCMDYIETITALRHEPQQGTDGECDKNKMYDHIIILENNISSFYVDNDFKRLKL